MNCITVDDFTQNRIYKEIAAPIEALPQEQLAALLDFQEPNDLRKLWSTRV